jgi:hypothetical protein
VADFYEAAVDNQLPEATRLAETSRPCGQPSWSRSPRTPPTPSTEGFNRVIKQTKRVGCGAVWSPQFSGSAWLGR